MSWNLDGLSWTMMGLGAFLTVVVSLYRGRDGVARMAAPWAFCLFACLALAARSWLGFTVYLELSSLVLAAMIAVKDREAALWYLYAQLLGGGLLLAACAMASSVSGGVAPVGPVPSDAIPLFLVALGVKTGFPGLHFWLPKAHSQAPAEVSLLLSGYSVKLGIYGLLRLFEGPSPALMALGVLMALYGVSQALAQHDAKRLLAYHTMSQLGFMVTALAAGTSLGRLGALVHVVSHGLFKGLLFLCAGGLEVVYGTRDLRFLGRGARDLPWLFGLFLVGATAIAGVPWTSGAVSKSVIKASLQAVPTAKWALALAGLGTVLSFCKFGWYGFLRPSRPSSVAPPIGSIPLRAYGAMGLLGAATLAMGWTPFPTAWAVPGMPCRWGWDELVSSAVPVLCGLAVFALTSRALRPRDGHVPDVEDGLAWGAPWLRAILAVLRRFHAGSLRLYLAVLSGVLLSLLVWLSSVP